MVFSKYPLVAAELPMKIENIELERNEEAKETQNIKNNIDTPHNEE